MGGTVELQRARTQGVRRRGVETAVEKSSLERSVRGAHNLLKVACSDDARHLLAEFCAASASDEAGTRL